MIIGIGSDIVSMKRLRNSLHQFDKKMIDRLFTSVEQAYALKAKCELGQLGRYAKRYAAKEAFSKALGTGIGQISWQDMTVAHDEKGAPFLTVSGKAQELLLQKMPFGYKPKIHLSLTDEALYAVAFVIIEAVPETL